MFNKEKKCVASSTNATVQHQETPWINCPICGEILYVCELEKTMQVCPKCSHHFRLTALDRLAVTLDEGSFIEMDADLETSDPISFPNYKEKLAMGRATAALNDAILTGEGSILGWPVLVGVFEPHFIMGSMGIVVGEKIVRLVEAAIEQRISLLLFSSSGGARMQEGVFSLMQMAKTSAAIARLNEAGVLYISVLTDPATGGVLSSIAALGDIIIAEPGALIGFAGRRVAKKTLNEELPPDFQTAEFCLKHGFIDRVIPRQELRVVFAQILSLHSDYHCKQTLADEWQRLFRERGSGITDVAGF